ncbi:MAG TPA: transcription elongation factor GreA [Tepidiformaceae bacterium]
MSDQSAPTSGVGVTLGEAFQEYLNSLKTEQRNSQRGYVWKCVEHFGDDLPVRALSGSRVESYAESQIRPSDPAAPERVAALKSWFQFLKKRNFTDQNFGVHIRVRRPHGRAAGEVTRVRAEEALVEMTAEGHEALKRELQELNSQTPDLVKAIALAREDKDFRENAPLDAAREALAFSDQRKKAIETALKRAVIVEAGGDDRSTMGSLVTVTRLDSGTQTTYKLVGAREANAAEQKISVESPVGKELLNRRAGEEVSVKVPSGVLQYRIDSVVHP